MHELSARDVNPWHDRAVAHPSETAGKVMTSYQIHVASEFSRFPAGRFRTDGPHSGEKFREDFLVPALRDGKRVTVLLDGTLGYGSSFLEEAFGGLVREHGFSANDLHKNLTVHSANDRSLITEIWSYIDEASKRARTK